MEFDIVDQSKPDKDPIKEVFTSTMTAMTISVVAVPPMIVIAAKWFSLWWGWFF